MKTVSPPVASAIDKIYRDKGLVGPSAKEGFYALDVGEFNILKNNQ